MAGAILTSLIKRLSNSLSPGASSSSSKELPSSSEKELQKLAGTMNRIHAILENAEERDVSDKSEQLRLREMREVAYDAEDAVDEYEYEVLHAKVEARRRAMAGQMGDQHDKVIFDLNSYHPKVSIPDELADRVKDIRERFEEIDDWSRLLDKVGKRRCIRKWKPSETTSFFDPTKTFGREDEKKQIITWLLQEEEEASNGDSTISILAIVGTGGLGKTTLAQMAYNDTRVDQRFNLRGWVHVSEEFDVASLVRKICICLSMNTSNRDEINSINLMSLNELHWKLRVMLDGKKFFLVLDDVWNQKIELWSLLKTFLVGVGEGKILVTTRNNGVAEIMQTTPAIILDYLSSEDSWLLFKKIAYEGGDQNYSEIGKKIVDKCQGLPLAIKVLAGILRVEDEDEALVDILESELLELDEKGEGIIPILKLSYDRLPIELKQCFAYLYLFPKGSDLDESTIIRHWISSGFIQPKGEKMEEDVGNDYFNEFLQRSILQYYFVDSSRKEIRMHDLIHDLAGYVANDEYLLLTNLKSECIIPRTTRHVSMHIENQNELEIENLKPPLGEVKQLRTLICHVRGEIPSSVMDQLPNIRSLRTLDLNTYSWYGVELPDSIDRLKHLRYLRIEGAKPIPASVYRLHFLQTFLASGGHPGEIKLSRDVGDLINLRHLWGYDRTHPLPREVAGLSNLQSLPSITLGVEEGDFKLRDLKGLPNLRDSYLEVRGLKNVAWPDVTPGEAYFKDSRRIKGLEFCWGYDDDDENEEMAGDVDEKERQLAAQALDSLQPHGHIEMMVIEGYPGVVLPTWLGHELPLVKTLHISGMRRVKSLVAPAMMEMEKKSTEHDPSWQWQQGAEEDPDFLPSLLELTIDDCPQLRRLPSLPSLTKLYLQFEFSPELLSGGCCRRLPMLRNLKIVLYKGDCLIFPNDGSLDPLEELTIRYCRELSSVQGLGGLPCLRHLEIHDCPLLRMSPHERPPPNLQDVEIRKSPGVEEWYQNQVSDCQPTSA